MVVCKCRKATKLYCFVHKVPVCGQCISFAEHKLCVVSTYSDWVIDGDYDWPPKCSVCREVLEESDDVTRLGCFHLLHSRCLETHLQSFPAHTTPAGYTCPSCPASIWPPKAVPSSILYTKLKELISKSGLAATILGNDQDAVSSSGNGSSAPLAFSSAPLVSTESLSSAAPPEANSIPTTSDSDVPQPDTANLNGVTLPSVREAARKNEARPFQEIEPSSSSGQRNSTTESSALPPPFNKAASSPAVGSSQVQNGKTMVRKGSMRLDIPGPSTLGYDDDEDGSHRKYNRRGPLHQQVLRSLVPFWSPALPTLPVATPSYRGDKRESPAAEDLIDGRPPRRKHRHTITIDTGRLLLGFAILSCLATVVLLYYRLVQNLGNSSSMQSARQDQ